MGEESTHLSYKGREWNIYCCGVASPENFTSALAWVRQNVAPKSARTCSTINFLLQQSYYWFVTLSILFSSPFSNSLICDERSIQMKANLMPYLCNSVNNILVVILYGNHSLAFKHAQISNDLSLQSLQRKPRQQNKTINLVLKRQNN